MYNVQLDKYGAAQDIFYDVIFIESLFICHRIVVYLNQSNGKKRHVVKQVRARNCLKILQNFLLEKEFSERIETFLNVFVILA
jgi:hypothetical protein